MTFARYAIYYAPRPDTAWARFATSWLGWDMQTGRQVAHPPLPGLPLPIADITRRPRRYGLHGTLKPPFHLAAGTTRSELETACAALCQTLPPNIAGALRLTRMGRFLALCPPASAELSALAGTVMRGLDRFRAPLTGADLTRRRAAHLTPRQEANLIAWGYPHVLQDFRFHLTLTGPLKMPDLTRVQSVLESSLAPLLPEQTGIADLALVGQDGDGLFHLLRRFELTG